MMVDTIDMIVFRNVRNRLPIGDILADILVHFHMDIKEQSTGISLLNPLHTGTP